MMYLLALVLPPLALLLSGRPFQAVFNGLLWVLGLVLTILPFLVGLPLVGLAALWALMAVHGRKQESRDRRLVDEALRRDRAQRIG
ncbi:MAG: YqaE/Pmp3 family membrane protein [Acetobacteraceae bacterium]|nr:YqaE/Pmp3 family membrane protein [Acetobacteraceae bacterium]